MTTTTPAAPASRANQRTAPPINLMKWIDAHRHEMKPPVSNKYLYDGEDFFVIAGPCAVESERQVREAAEAVARAGARLLRGGAFKPRTSPYAFQGLGEEGLRLLAEAGREAGLPTVTEVGYWPQLS